MARCKGLKKIYNSLDVSYLACKTMAKTMGTSFSNASQCRQKNFTRHQHIQNSSGILEALAGEIKLADGMSDAPALVEREYCLQSSPVLPTFSLYISPPFSFPTIFKWC